MAIAMGLVGVINMILDELGIQIKDEPVKYPTLLKLKKLRKAAGYTQTDFADAISCSWSKYCAIEHGRIMPNELLLAQIAEELGVEPDDLLKE